MIDTLSFPYWNGLHPVIVHFTIVLLLVAPLFIVLGAVLPSQKGKPLLVSALILMLVGTVSIFVSTETGEAAEKVVGEASQIKKVLEQHQALAGTTKFLFSALTAAFAVLLFVPTILRRELARTFSAALFAAFLLLYGTGALFLVNTADQGGRVTHALGVQAGRATSQEPHVQAGALPGRADHEE